MQLSLANWSPDHLHQIYMPTKLSLAWDSPLSLTGSIWFCGRNLLRVCLGNGFVVWRRPKRSFGTADTWIAILWLSTMRVLACCRENMRRQRYTWGGVLLLGSAALSRVSESSDGVIHIVLSLLEHEEEMIPCNSSVNVTSNYRQRSLLRRVRLSVGRTCVMCVFKMCKCIYVYYCTHMCFSKSRWSC